LLLQQVLQLPTQQVLLEVLLALARIFMVTAAAAVAVVLLATALAVAAVGVLLRVVELLADLQWQVHLLL